MEPSDERRLLDLWEVAAGRHPIDRALVLLAERVAAPADLAIAERDRMLLALRAEWFGPRIATLATCPACGERMELSFRAEEALPAAPAEGERAGIELTCRPGEAPVRVRHPTSRDLAAVARLPVAAARRALLCRLLAPADGDGAAAPEPSEETLAAAEEALRAAAPDSEIVVRAACAACGAEGAFLFDPAGHVWAEVDAAARRLLLEVHALASRYGWTEEEILSVPPARRRRYLELAGA